MAKYGTGLQFIIAGDTNRLNLNPILSLSPSLKQLVTTPTRLNPDAILDPVITTMQKYYQTPVTKPPIENDENKQGKPSDHLVVLMYPISQEMNCPPRQVRHVECRSLPQSGINKMGVWIQEQTWGEIYKAKDVNEKAQFLQNMLMKKLDEIFPVKLNRFTSDDKPWVTSDIKQLDRKCKREFFKNHKSQKWQNLRQKLKAKCEKAKNSYYRNIVEDLKESNPSQWYTKIKRMGGLPDKRSAHVMIEELSGLPDQSQADKIAEYYAKVSNEYKPLSDDDISPDLYRTDQNPPHIEPYQMYQKIQKMSTRKANIKGDIPMKIIKEFSVELAEPLAHILSYAISSGQYPDLYKFETITPVPKCYPPEEISQLRKISGLKSLAKVFDSFLAEFITKDMMATQDPAQYGNKKGMSTQHYLVRMVHNILTALDGNTKEEAKAVLVNMIDWKSAFDRQCHRLGILSFIRNGVRKSLIPILISYCQNREMAVKWNGKMSKKFPLPGGGAQGGQLGQLEYLSQSDNNVDFLDLNEKYKFIDDLSTLEIINLIMSGLTSYNFKQHVASDIGNHGQFLPAENAKSQNHLERIDNWTKKNKMELNTRKTKYMVINFTKKYQFSTRLSLDNKMLEEVKECNLLGLSMNNQLTWYNNTEKITQKANTRMIILHKLYEFNIPMEEMVNIYILFIRSVVEYACVVWHSSISSEESNNIERVQKTALRIILKSDYDNYHSALRLVSLSTLKERRRKLSLSFAKKCLKSDDNKDLFPQVEKLVNTRQHERFFVTPARTERLAKSTIPYLQRLLNEE